MSAFVVDPETVNLVVWLATEARMREDGSETIHRGATFAGVDLAPVRVAVLAFNGAQRAAGAAAQAEVGRRLYALNVRAVNGRYPSHPSEPLPEYAYTSPVRVPSLASGRAVAPLVGAYKALRCLEYQCSEDATMAAPLMADLAALRAVVADRIVCALPEFDAAPTWR